ncbi:MAG: type II toxin-antitoxin system RelE/ParE family toxin [Brevundimonas sp.]|uniref:type II toxin-antitoxin system RelE/ParE family toxin n=1 Tax=Brevundimonas sp. TaxID=1871086 RepID=UPI0017BA7722|nr:type II toxin-antitoxin system RelE/ParE family toxin [Brevundimonas sp.]MBA4805835.1 type II toxin-antitoxin system RelE/ParE family toxin [Brevundimonas sp.]
MRRVVWTDQALADLEAISLYLASFSPRVAARFFVRLKAAGDSLASFAEKGRPAIHGTRELTTVKPYLIRYTVAGDRVYIVRIRHSARRPAP